MQVVASVKLPGKGIEGVVERGAVAASRGRAPWDGRRRRRWRDARPCHPPRRRRRRWRNRRAGGRIRGRRSLRRRCGAETTTASINSSSARSVDIRPVKNSSAGTRRRLSRRDNSISPRSASRLSGNFGARIGMRDRAADGAARAGLGMADPGQGRGEQRLVLPSSGQASNSAWRTVAPTRMASSCTSMPPSSGMRMMSTSTAGCARRIDSIGTSVWPPASTLASLPQSASAAWTSARVSARR